MPAQTAARVIGGSRSCCSSQRRGAGRTAADRALRHAVAARQRRHGRGLSGARCGTRRRGGDQDRGGRRSAPAQRLRREAELLARLSHPHVCPILEWQEEDDGAWIVMPVLDGTTSIVARDLTVDTIVELLQQAARGVAAAHVAGLVHRDLKPANLMVLDAGGSQPRAVVMDFGIAHASDASTLTGTHEVLGTPAYMAPEQGARREARRWTRAPTSGASAPRSTTR
ncbi:MAG: serine/threonine protein kinase [Rhodanobacteraceae bacterium]|nr:serine/threonine protein kinase [Rhodanobacteraceae bacterium]